MKSIVINGYIITRVESYGFRSNTPIVEWRVYRPGNAETVADLLGVFYKLKWAKEYIRDGHADQNAASIYAVKA